MAEECAVLLSAVADRSVVGDSAPAAAGDLCGNEASVTALVRSSAEVEDDGVISKRGRE